MYKDVSSRVRVGNGFSEELDVVVCVHQLASLNHCVRGTSRDFHIGCPRELMYAEYLMISAESIEELLVKFKTWKSEMEKKRACG